MSQGVVKVTPRPGGMGTLQVSVADANPYHVVVGAMLSFPSTSFPLSVGNNVECIFTSATACTVTKVLVPA